MESNSLIKGLSWSLIEKVSIILVQILLEIILARLLVPGDYGILGMIMVVVAFANVFVDGGFSSALIHFKDRNAEDYSTVFFTGLIIGIFSYIIIFILAPYVSLYYDKDVTTLIRVISISIICNSFGVIYRAKLSINMDFKKQTLFSLSAMLISGFIGVYMAYAGYGVWALVIQLVVFSILYNFFLFYIDKHLPSFIISRKSINRIFGFGSKIFVSSVMQAVYLNAFPILLGRFHNAQIVGLYTKANQLTTYPAGIFAFTVQRVYFPYLVNFQNDRKKVFELNHKFIKLYSLVCFPIATIVIFYALPIIVFVLSSTWIDMVLPFQILLVSSVFFPIIVMNMNIFQIIGKANLYLYTEILTKVIGVSILVLSYKHGFIFVCYGILLQIVVQFLITSLITSNLLKVNAFKQIFDVFPLLIVNCMMLTLALYTENYFENTLISSVVIFVLIIFYFIIFRFAYANDFFYLRNLFVTKVLKL